MVHTRIRKFNTRSVWKGQDIDNDLCMAVRAGNMVFVRGQTGMDLKGKIHGINDPGAQTENAMRCLKVLLEEAGSKLEDVCKIVIYVTDRAYREAVDYIAKNPHVYVSTGFIKTSGMQETPAVVKLFEERFSKLYTGKWDQNLLNSNRAVFETAIEMGNLESVPPDWFTFEYAN